MSADSYTVYPTATGSSPDIESAAGKLIGACLIMPAVAAGAAIYGISKAAVAIGKFGIEQYAKHCEKKAREAAANQEVLKRIMLQHKEKQSTVDKITAKLGDRKKYGVTTPAPDIRTSFSAISARHEDELLKARNNCYLSLDQKMERFADEKNVDFDKITESVSVLLSQWDQTSKALQQNYTAKVTFEADAIKTNIKAIFDSAHTQIVELGKGVASKEKEKQIASERLVTAHDFILQLAQSNDGFVEPQNIEMFIQSYKSAEAFYDSEDYTTALIIAENLINEVISAAAEAEAHPAASRNPPHRPER